MPLFGNGSGGGFFNDLKTTLGFAPREDYDDEYDMYSDNFDEFSDYDDHYYDDRGYEGGNYMGNRSYDAGYAYDEEYDDGYGEVIERDPADREYYGLDRYQQGISLPSVYDIRRSVVESERERRSGMNRQSYYSEDYLPSGSVERESAMQAPSQAGRFGYTDCGGSDRKVVLVVPTRYDDAERVAKALKAHETVVLDFCKVRPDLMKRVLDFSFGAASVTGAQVDCLANKVYAITSGGPITEGEKVRLRSQGVRL